jgi:hypothetical protein
MVLLPIEIISIVILGAILGLAFLNSPKVSSQSQLRRALGLVKTELLENDRVLSTLYAIGRLPNTLCDHRFQTNRGVFTQDPRCADSLEATYKVLASVTANGPKETIASAKAQITNCIEEINAAVATTNWARLKANK